MPPPPFSQVVLETQACWLERAVGPWAPVLPTPTVTLPSLAGPLLEPKLSGGRAATRGREELSGHSAPWSAFSPWKMVGRGEEGGGSGQG